VPRAIGNVAALARKPLQHGAKQKRSAAGKQAGNWSRLVLVSESSALERTKLKLPTIVTTGTRIAVTLWHSNSSYPPNCKDEGWTPRRIQPGRIVFRSAPVGDESSQSFGRWEPYV
jgi:hypothetical protein